MINSGRLNKTDTPIFETSVHSLEKISDSMLRHIKGYEKRTGKEANDKYVDSFYRWIKELDALSNMLEAMNRFDVWVEVEKEIEKKMKIDDDIGCAIIYLPLRQKGHAMLVDFRDRSLGEPLRG